VDALYISIGSRHCPIVTPAPWVPVTSSLGADGGMDWVLCESPAHAGIITVEVVVDPSRVAAMAAATSASERAALAASTSFGPLTQWSSALGDPRTAALAPAWIESLRGLQADGQTAEVT